MSQGEGNDAGPSLSHSAFSAHFTPATSSGFTSGISSFSTPSSSVSQSKGNTFSFGPQSALSMIQDEATSGFGRIGSDVAPSTATSLSSGPSRVLSNGSRAASSLPPLENASNDNENALGGSQISDNARKKRFEDLPKQNRFFEMKKQRDALRLKYIREGVLPDPDRAQDLSAAKSLKGTCMQMCPEFEREEREFQNEGDALEMFPGTNRIDPEIAVKIYRRPAAGRELSLPEDVRPPSVLRQTLDYLFHKLLPPDPASPRFTAVQPFMWNRTRAIRQDFTVQGLRGELEIECHERIARYHILCLHWKGGLGADGWSEQQELEQLRKTIRSLTEFYEDYRRSSGKSSSNEAEFRAYNLLLHMQDPETLREVEGLPKDIFDAPSIQAALRLRGYAQRSNNVVRRGRPLNTEATMNLWTRFFGEIRRSENVTYLLACLAENTFSQVRAGAIKAMSKTYLERHAPLSTDFLKRVLGMDSEEEARQFALALNCEEVHSDDAQSSIIGLRLAKANEDKPLPSVTFSQDVVEMKRGGATVQDIVDGKTSNAAPLVQNPLSPVAQSAPALISTSQIKPTLPSFRAPAQASSLEVMPSATSSDSSSSSIAFLPQNVENRSSAMNNLGRPALSPNGKISSRLSPSAPVFTPTSANFQAKLVNERKSSQAHPDEGKLPLSLQAPSCKISPPLPSFGAAGTSSSTLSEIQQIGHTSSQEKPDSKGFSGLLEKKRDIESSAANFTKQDLVQSKSPVKTPTVRTPKRTVSSVASLLAEQLINTFVDQRIANISHQACLRELRQRKVEARKELIDENVATLYQALQREVIEDCLAEVSSEAIADEFRSRCLENLVLCRRRKVLAKATERKRQAERLEEVRRKLDRRGIANTVAKTSNHDVVADSLLLHSGGIAKTAKDLELKNALRHAEESRNNLWMKGTFADALATYLNDTSALRATKDWSVGLATHESGHASSDWLETKMSLRGTSHYEIEVKGNVTLHLYNLKTTFERLKEEIDSIGLIMFELTDLSTDADERSKSSCNHDCMRLEEITQQTYISRSQFLPKLMILCWCKDQCRDKKQLLKNLRLGATDEQRFQWSQVDICCLGNSEVSPQESFEASLRTLLINFPLNQRQHRLNLEDAAELCNADWIKLLINLQGSSSTLSTEDAYTLARQAFKAATMLMSKVLRLILAISDTILEEGEFANYTEIPLPPDTTSSKTLYELAFEQLQMCEREEDDGKIFVLLRLWLIQESQSESIPFPWLAYFEQLFHCQLSRLQEVWLDCKLPLSETNQLLIKSISSLVEKFWIELEWKLGELNSSRSHSHFPKKKRALQDVDLKQVKSKSRRLEVNNAERVSHSGSNGKAVHSSSISNLRALMASAAKILDNSSSL